MFGPNPEDLAVLAGIPDKYGQPDSSKIAYLEKTQKDDNGGYKKVQLPYEGHAEITLDLIEIDPGWEVEIATDDHGRWIVDRNEAIHEATIYGHLTVRGVSRPCVGIAEIAKVSRKGDVFPVNELHKQLYSDLLRNGAMRFGIGTKLWSKAEGSAAEPAQEVPTTIPEEIALDFNARIAKLDADKKKQVADQLKALGSIHIQKLELSQLPAVVSIVTAAVLEDRGA